jgi:acetyl esterase/lipase
MVSRACLQEALSRLIKTTPGGGFSMGSSYFYMEFFFAWVTLLKLAGFRNPALFALEYTLVPDAVYPTQLRQTVVGYEHILSIAQDPSRICVGGDSAGGTLILSLLLYLASSPAYGERRPRLAVLISPWVTLVSPENHNTQSDYLNAESLHLYARQYAGSAVSLVDPLVSPGMCKDLEWWSRAAPSAGFLFQYGSEEVFCPEIRNLIALLENTRGVTHAREEEGFVHAWTVARLFLSDTKAERQKGLKHIAQATWKCMGEGFGSQ